MKRLCTALALALLAGCTPAFAQGLNVRSFDRTVDPRNVTTTDKLTWYAGESVEYIIRSRRGREVVDVPPESTVVWRVRQDTNDYLVAAGEVVTNGTVRFRVYSPDANLAPGLYTSWAEAFQGTNLVGVLERASVEVKWRPGDDYAIVQPITNLFDQVLAAWNTACSAGVAVVQGGLTAHVADTENPHGVTAEQIGALTAETDAAALSAIASVSGRVDVVEGWGDHAEAGYLTAETDPAFAAAPAYGITTDLIAAWNLAYGWGNHASAGYLTNESDPAGIAALGMFSNSVFSIMNDMSSDIVYAVSLAEGASTGSEPLWTAASNSVLYVGDVADVAYGTATDEAYRGDWGAAVSNAAVLRSIATVPVFDAYSAPASESLPFVVTNTGVLTLSGLTSGSIGIRLTTTNASGIALYAVVVKDGDGETIATINPACDGTEQSARWPWNASETLTIEATGIASPVEGAESAIITAAQVETWADVSLVGKTNDLADQHLYVDYPAATNEAANRAYADDAADAALALALGEIATATFNRDLAGYVQRWNPRFDTVADSNSLTTLYGGSTALRLDGNAAQIVPEIKAFSVEAGTVATLTVWSYAGGAINLVPQVTTNLITGPWESKPENVVSATNVDQYTAQVVFTNDAERTLFVRLIDTSGGDSVPVFRVFGGIAFGDGDAITNWPTSGSGISAAEAGTIATNVLSTATTNSMPLIDFGSGGGWTNLSFSGTGNAITNATAAGTTLTLERGTIEGGGGTGDAPSGSGIHPRMTAVTNNAGAAYIWPASSAWWRVYADNTITGIVPVVDSAGITGADLLLLGIEISRGDGVDFSWGGGDAPLAGVTNEVPANEISLHGLWRPSGGTNWVGF